MGQGSQVQSFENVDVNPFLAKDKHKTAAKVQLKRTGVLAPVQDPRARDHSLGGSSDGGTHDRGENRSMRSMQGSAIGLQQSHGYVSGGMQTDTESARLSNVQPYKFNSQNRNQKQLNIRKINPNQVQLKPVSRGNGIGAGLHKIPIVCPTGYPAHRGQCQWQLFRVNHRPYFADGRHTGFMDHPSQHTGFQV